MGILSVSRSVEFANRAFGLNQTIANVEFSTKLLWLFLAAKAKTS